MSAASIDNFEEHDIEDVRELDHIKEEVSNLEAQHTCTTKRHSEGIHHYYYFA